MTRKKYSIGCIRFRGVVRECRRELVAQINQELSKDIDNSVVKNFVEKYLSFPPLCLYYCQDPPIDRWCRDPWENYYDKISGQWVVQTMFVINHQDWKNFEEFMLPYLMESIDELEVWEEDEHFSQKCTLKQFELGKMITLGIIDDEGMIAPVRTADSYSSLFTEEKREKDAEELSN